MEVRHGEPAAKLPGMEEPALAPAPLSEASLAILLIEPNDEERGRIEAMLLGFGYRVRLGSALRSCPLLSFAPDIFFSFSGRGRRLSGPQRLHSVTKITSVLPHLSGDSAGGPQAGAATCQPEQRQRVQQQGCPRRQRAHILFAAAREPRV